MTAALAYAPPFIGAAPLSTRGNWVGNTDLGAWLRRHRRAARLTQKELSEATATLGNKVGQSYIAKIEGGEASDVSRDKIEVLSKAMALDRRDALEGLLLAAGLTLDDVRLVGTHQETLPSGRIVSIAEPDGTPIPLDDEFKKLLDLQTELLKRRPE